MEKDTDRDNYMTAEEAKAYGLIDDVIAHENKVKTEGTSFQGAPFVPYH